MEICMSQDEAQRSAFSRTGCVSVWWLRSQIWGMLQPVFASRANPNWGQNASDLENCAL